MLYRYTAVNREGASVQGEREAADEKTLARALRSEGFLLTSARLGSASWKRWLPALWSVGQVEKMTFARNLGVMIGAGLSMTRALEASAEQTHHAKFRMIIADLRQEITKGAAFTQALAKHKDVFSDFFIHMAEAGELSGKLESSFKLLARQMKRDHDLYSKVKSAMVYPAVVIGTLIAIAIIMLIYVVPALSQTFKELKVDLPLTTRVIIIFSDSFIQYGLAIGAALIVAFYAIIRFFRSDYGGRVSDLIILRIPVFGSLVKKFNSARAARTIASLIAAGLSITKALEVTSRVVGNSEFSASLVRAIAEVEKGRALSSVMRESPKLYDPMFIQMLTVGEETGTMSRMLLRVALFYEEEVTNVTKNLSSVVEPAMMVIVGVIVGFFALSMIQPLYSSLGQVGF